MKAVMYHYVRSHEVALEHQRYLHTDAFRRQLDWFGDEVGFVSRPAFEEAVATGVAPPGVVLTFDDALCDHADTVLPELEARGLWGIFFVPTAPYRTGRLLAVHRLHLLLGSVAGPELLALLDDLVDDDMLVHGGVEPFHTATYGRLDDDGAGDEVKRTLNYLIADEHRDAVVDALLAATGTDAADAAAGFYLSAEQLRDLERAGMVIGSHGDRHVVLSTLSAADQRADLEESLRTLRTLVDQPVASFCYPYGGEHSFDATTVRLLDGAGIRVGFSVEPRDITATDLRTRPLALPRYDCNAFPHGRAHRGRTPPRG
jgi:peptidoglycan/xylan/chitin deacetylase (PgdA/CDA1 family)